MLIKELFAMNEAHIKGASKPWIVKNIPVDMKKFKNESTPNMVKALYQAARSGMAFEDWEEMLEAYDEERKDQHEMSRQG